MTAHASDRRVRTLRLAATDEVLARRGAFLIEDALRTASVPGGEGGQLLLVRRLALGRILPGQSPASVALAVERALWRLGVAPVHGGHPAAADGLAVYFRDRVEAAVSLALRLAEGRDASAWFWPLAVLSWQPGMSAAAGLRAALAAALAAVPGPAGAIALADALLAAGCLSALLAVLAPDDGPALLAACGWPRVDVTPAASPVARGVPPRWRPLLARWLATWGMADARTSWLATTALASEQPGRQQDFALANEAAGALAALAAANARADTATLTGELPPLAGRHPAPGPRAAAGAGLGRNHEAPPDRLPWGSDGSPSSAPATPPLSGRLNPLGDAAGRGAAGGGPCSAPALPWPVEAEFTRWAGLYLLLPVLARLGMAEMLAAQPHLAAVALPQRVLWAVARRLCVPADDAALNGLRPARASGPCPFVAPASWLSLEPAAHLARAPFGSTPENRARPDARNPDGFGPRFLVQGVAGRPGVRVLTAANSLPLALWRGRAPDAVRALIRAHDGSAAADVTGDESAPLPPVLGGNRRAGLEALAGLVVNGARGPALPTRGDLAILVHAWELAVRGWLAQHTALSLRDVVARPGRIAVTRTHLDIFFDLAQADVRVRRVGLDLDPGWLPWLGRVVAYHYEENALWQVT